MTIPRFRLHTLLAIAAMLIQGCASYVNVPLESSDRKKIPSWYSDHREAGSESQSWYTPWSRQEYLYGVAEDVSPSMEMAIKKATLKAKSKIADRIHGEIQRQTRLTYREEGSPSRPVGDTQTLDEIQNAIQKISLGPYSTAKREVVYNPSTGNYRAFVLLRVPARELTATLENGR
jgi:hypothetical protein